MTHSKETTNGHKVSVQLNKYIYNYYRYIIKYCPIVIMLLHWYGTYDFHTNPTEIIIRIEENEPCIAFLYSMTYIVPVVFMLPASYFYKYCWMFRIPFFYFVGISVSRLYFRSWLITNEMKDVDYLLILFTLSLYIYGFFKKRIAILPR